MNSRLNIIIIQCAAKCNGIVRKMRFVCVEKKTDPVQVMQLHASYRWSIYDDRYGQATTTDDSKRGICQLFNSLPSQANRLKGSSVIEHVLEKLRMEWKTNTKDIHITFWLLVMKQHIQGEFMHFDIDTHTDTHSPHKATSKRLLMCFAFEWFSRIALRAQRISMARTLFSISLVWVALPHFLGDFFLFFWVLCCNCGRIAYCTRRDQIDIKSF